MVSRYSSMISFPNLTCFCTSEFCSDLFLAGLFPDLLLMAGLDIFFFMGELGEVGFLRYVRD